MEVFKQFSLEKLEEIYTAVRETDAGKDLLITVCVGGDLPGQAEDPEGTVVFHIRARGDTAARIRKQLSTPAEREEGGPAEEDQAGSYMEQAVSYIEEHLRDEDLSVGSVAASLYLNPVYFGRIFKQNFRMSFRQYVSSRRMERARQLLEEKDDSIGSVCEQVGINSLSYFSQLFKRYTGKCPSEYKRAYADMKKSG